MVINKYLLLLKFNIYVQCYPDNLSDKKISDILKVFLLTRDSNII